MFSTGRQLILPRPKACFIPAPRGRFWTTLGNRVAMTIPLLNAQVYGLRVNAYLANFIAIVLVSIWNFSSA